MTTYAWTIANKGFNTEQPEFDTLILDLDGVIPECLLNAVTTVSPKAFIEIRNSQTWEAYQRGFISETDFHSQVIAEVTEPVTTT